jgi:hypothetical protein
MLDRQEYHILIGCADARDLSQIQVESVREVMETYREKGVTVDLGVIRAAGSFVTQDVFMDIRRLIEQNQREKAVNFRETRYYVHIQSHGELDPNSDRSYTSHIYRMNIVQGSPLNCGMLGATGLGVELEQLLVEEHLEVIVGNKFIRVDSSAKIRELLREVYAHDGYLAGDWLKSIDYLRTHPRTQRAILEKLIETDSELCSLGIMVTAGIQDYSIHALIRVDNGDPVVPFWDDVQQTIRNKGRDNQEMLKNQSEKQDPHAGLLCMADPQRTSRTLAAAWYMRHKDINHDGKYLPNTVFNMSGSAFDIPHCPFGPYVIAGFFYSVSKLGLTDQMVMGFDKAQTDRMILKIKNDPIMNLIVNRYKVNLIPVNHSELIAEAAKLKTKEVSKN